MTMNRFASLLLATCCACSSGGGVQDTEARVEVAGAAAFGRVYVGETGTVDLPVKSVGSGWLTVEAVAPEGDVTSDFTSDNARVAPGATLHVKLSWAPAAAGALATRVRVTTDVEGAREWFAVVTGEARTLPDCDDSNDCTTDTFDRATETCGHTTHTNACNDGSACTVDDRCLDGVCRGVARTCDDEDVCTLNVCDPAVGCVFPPDGRQCDDEDPCTADVCDRDAGCSHPNAEAGTACGLFSCAIAHVCVFGTCRELNVTGSSDGFPCFDGDLCTEGDECLDGACNPGPRVHHEPRVEAVLPTFGGQNSSVISDGYRYLFAYDHAVDFTYQGPAGLVHVSRLPLPGEAPRGVVFDAGRFLIADTEGLTLVVARPETAAVAWTKTWRELGFDPATWVRATILRVPQGVFVVLDRLSRGVVPSHAAVLTLDAAGAVTTTVAPFAFLYAEWDLDADAGVVIATGSGGTVSIDLAHPEDPPPFVALWTPPAAKVSVSGRRVAMLHAGSRIDVVGIDAPRSAPVACTPVHETRNSCLTIAEGCGSPEIAVGSWETCSPNGVVCQDPLATCTPVTDLPCTGCDCVNCDCDAGAPVAHVCMRRLVGAPTGTLSLPVTDATDVVLDGDLLAWSSPSGTYAVDLAPSPTGAPPPLVPVRIDAMPGRALDRGPSMLTVSGSIALPLLRKAGAALTAPGAFTRVTGPGHGDVTTVTDAVPPSVLVGGPEITGALDLLTKKFTGWRVSEGGRQQLIRGVTRTVVAEPRVVDSGAADDGPCSGVPIGITDAVGQVSVVVPCELHTGRVAVSGSTLWTMGDDTSDIRNALPDRVVRAWPLAPFSSTALGRLPVGNDSGVTTLRASDSGGVVAGIYRPDTGLGRMTLMFLGLGPDGPFAKATEEVFPTWFGEDPPSDLAANDGDFALIGNGGEVQLRSLVASGVPVTQPQQVATFPRADVDAPIRIPWMAKGRAWLGYRATALDALESSQILSEATYDAAAETLSVTGEVELSSRLVSAYDTGIYTVVATEHGVEVVAPACR